MIELKEWEIVLVECGERMMSVAYGFKQRLAIGIE